MWGNDFGAFATALPAVEGHGPDGIPWLVFERFTTMLPLVIS